MGSMATSVCTGYNFHSWIDVINLIVSIIPGWNINSLGTNVPYSGRKYVCVVPGMYIQRNCEVYHFIVIEYMHGITAPKFLPHLTRRYFSFKDGFQCITDN